MKFPKKARTIKVDEDLGMKDYPGVTFQVWDDPSRQVSMTLLEAILSEETTEEDVDRYFEAVTRYIISSNIDGLKFDTVDETVESFQHPDLPWGFMYDVVALGVADLLEQSVKLKKVLRALSNRASSGENKKNEEVQSPQE